MKTDVIEQSTTRVQVTVGFDPSEVAATREKLVRDFSKQARIPGFRPGKVPQSIVEKRFSKDLQTELQQRLIRQAYNDGLLKADLQIYSVVDIIDDKLMGSDQPEASFVVDIQPKFDLPEYKGLPVEKGDANVEEAEVESSLQRMLNQRAEFKVCDRAAEKGDFVKCSYEGKIKSKLISEIAPDHTILGTQENTWEEAGCEDGMGVAAVVNALVGMKPGDSSKVEYTFPEDHAVEDLRGKKASYSIQVHEVRQKILPEINEEFLKSVQAESLDDLKAQIRKSLEARKAQEVQNELRKAVSEKLRASVEFDLPESAVKRESESIMEDFMQHQMRRGADPQAIQEAAAKITEEVEKTARERVKLDILIGRIVEKESIKLDHTEFSQVIMQQAMSIGMPVDKFVNQLKKDEDQIQAIRNRAVFSKALDFLVAEATVTENA